MNRKEIQRQRMISYFVKAAKEIIKEEGVEQLSVRKVGDRAGYSYATIYNYFTDLNHLLWYVALELLQEIAQAVAQSLRPGVSGREALRRTYRAYVEYMLENPSVFRFIFFTQLGDVPAELQSRANRPLLGAIVTDALTQCASEGLIAESDIPLIGGLVIRTLHGLLLFRFSGKGQLTSEQVYTEMDSYIDFILSRSPKESAADH